MTETIMHCFDPGKAGEEGKIIGSLLAGYGELELELTSCLIATTGDFDASLKTLFRIQSAEKRINKADELMKSEYAKAGLGIACSQSISDMHWCRKIRNQYAHCQWYYTDIDGLCFVNLEAIAKKRAPLTNIGSHKLRLAVDLLTRQMDFYVYLRKCFWYLAESYQRRASQLKDPGAKLRSPVYPMPQVMARPPLHY